MTALRAPFPYFGGKSKIASLVWERFGRPSQYIEPFCGSAAMLLAAPERAPLEVVGDLDCYIANFWRAVKFQPDAVTSWQDYPVSHIDLHARHHWLTNPERVVTLREALSDPDWPGDAKIAGWWLWGQCAWIGSGWCSGAQANEVGKIPHVGTAGRGAQRVGQIPHVSTAGMESQAMAASPTSEWIDALSGRLSRVRIIHGSWDRCLNTHYGSMRRGAAIFLDPPYKSFEVMYGEASRVAADVEEWCRTSVDDSMRVALCGHVGDYDLPEWSVMPWSRVKSTYGSKKTTDAEAVWFSPACLEVSQRGLFDEVKE